MTDGERPPTLPDNILALLPASGTSTITGKKMMGRSVMAELQVVIRPGQWLSSGDLWADCAGEEYLVRLDSAVANDPLLNQMPENPMRLHAPAEALAIASAAATRAKARGSIDAYGRIAVFMPDLKPGK